VEGLYTLQEAQRELARRQCGLAGHDVDLVAVAGGSEPVAAVCSNRCGHPGWRLERV
jgi:hypothetical protein